MLSRDDNSIPRGARWRMPLGWDVPFPPDEPGRADDVASPCGRHLYAVDRGWTTDPGMRWLGWILLAPSPLVRGPAGHPLDPFDADPTLDRCRRFARLWGFGGVRVHYVFSNRVVDAAGLETAAAPVHATPPHDELIALLFGSCSSVVAAWGSYPAASTRAVAAAITADACRHRRRLHCLGTLADSAPVAPLYARPTAELELYLNPEGATR